MNILAIETTGPVAGAALVCPDRVIAEYNINNKLTHSQVLMTLIDDMLKTANFDKNDIDLIACSAGPGSFTGLRIGAAAAKGLAFGLNLKIVPVSTLDALAYNINQSKVLAVPVMDARRNQVYTALYCCETAKRLTDYLACDIDFIVEEAGKTGGRAVFLGDGAELHKDKIAAAGFEIAPLGHVFQRAASVGAAALGLVKTAVSPPDFAPFYIRAPQAEREAGQNAN